MTLPPTRGSRGLAEADAAAPHRPTDRQAGELEARVVRLESHFERLDDGLGAAKRQVVQAAQQVDLRGRPLHDPVAFQRLQRTHGVREKIRDDLTTTRHQLAALRPPSAMGRAAQAQPYGYAPHPPPRPPEQQASVQQFKLLKVEISQALDRGELHGGAARNEVAQRYQEAIKAVNRQGKAWSTEVPPDPNEWYLKVSRELAALKATQPAGGGD